MKTKLLLLALPALLFPSSVHAADAAAAVPAQPEGSLSLPRPDFHSPGNIGRTYLDSDPAQFPQPVPKIFDLIKDPTEEYGATLTADGWVGGPMMKIVGEFEASLKKFPPITPGT